jgi:Domain of unknown function (DUF4349)
MNDTTALHLSAEDDARIDALLRDASERLHTTMDIEVPAQLPWDFPIEIAAANPDALVAPRATPKWTPSSAAPAKRTRKKPWLMRGYRPLAVAASMTIVVGGIGTTSLLGNKVNTTFSNISNTLPDGDYESPVAPLVTSENGSIVEEPSPVSPSSDNPSSPVITPSIAQDIIYTATVTAESSDIDGAANQIRIDTSAAGGMVFADTRSDGAASLTLKVPPQQFSELLRVVSTRATVTSRTMQASDVTADGVDLQARLSAATTSRDRVAALLAEATNLQNIVSLEGELRAREMEVEQLSGQLRVLRSQVAMGTISIQLGEPPLVSQATATTKVATHRTTPKTALVAGWNAATTGLQWVLIAGAAALPFTPLGLLAWGGRVVVRRRRMTTHNNPTKS